MSGDQDGARRTKPLLDRTITYGHILTAISFAVAGIAAFFGMKVELQNVDQHVAKIEVTLQQLANIIVQTARQDVRLNAIERRVDRIEQTEIIRRPQIRRSAESTMQHRFGTDGHREHLFATKPNWASQQRYWPRPRGQI